MTCVIVDDDLCVIEQLAEYITEIPELKLISRYTNPNIAATEISLSKGKIDILFADVEMPGLTGLELAKKVRDKFNFLIITSAHLHYAIDGYNVKANAFLSKPFNFQKFKSTVSTYICEPKLEKLFIFIKLKESKAILKIYIEEIIYIEADGNYIKFITTSASFTTLLKLSDIEEKLQPYKHFIRIHKSFIVSALHMDKYQNNFVFLTNKKSLPVTSTYKDFLLNFMA